MSTPLTNSFTSYELTDQEELEGCIYNVTQIQVLQNHLAAYAEQKLNLEYDPEHKDVFLQEDASLKAKIDLLQYLIDTSKVSEEARNQPQPNV